MSISKSERILNLFFVLLNSKRPVSRSEIQTRVSGYEMCESESAFERMFERDKDELRSIGVKIETLPIDPLFEDELGYLIDDSTFVGNEVSWTSEETAILNLASSIWKNTEFENLAKSATLKSGTRNISDSDLAMDLAENINLHNYRAILLGLRNRNIMGFEYLSLNDEKPRNRRVIGERFHKSGDFWFLEALDLADLKLKNYHFNRVVGAISLQASSEVEINLIKKSNKEISKIYEAKISINGNAKAVTHLTGGNPTSDNEIVFNYYDDESFSKYLITLSSIITDIEPQSLKDVYRKDLSKFGSVFK